VVADESGLALLDGATGKLFTAPAEPGKWQVEPSPDLHWMVGWDEQGHGGGPANCSQNDDPPRGYDSQGAQLWGHLVEPITLDPAVIVGDGQCDLTNDNIQCSPRLVR